MVNSVSVEQLLGTGVPINAHEAIAIVQQLLHQTNWTETSELTIAPGHVLLGADGEVRGESCAAPSITDIGWLLERMLRTGVGVRVTGALRLTIARACGAIDAPPFSSLATLSTALDRFEQGDRHEVIRDLVTRSGLLQPPAAEHAGEDRRRRGMSHAQLRRELRDADARLFALLAMAESAPCPVQASVPPRRQRRYLAALAAVPLSFLFGYAATMVTGHWMVTSEKQPATRSHREAEVPLPNPGAGDNATLALAGLGTWTTSDPDIATGTSGLTQAVPGFRGPEFSPAFATDGSALYFHTGGMSDRHSALMLESTSDAQPAVRTLIDDGSRNYHVQPSPDGQMIAFDSDRDGDRGVYVADSDGTHARRVSGPGYAAAPTWAPAGGRLTFVRAETGNSRVWNLWLLSLDTGESRRLTNYSFGQTWSASWFSDGARICYAHEDRIVVMDVTTGITREYQTPVEGHIVRTPAVSPAGDRVVFQVYRSGVWLLDLKTGSMRPVLADRTAEEFAWSPDGQRVAFHSRRSGQWQIWTLAIAPASSGGR